VFISKGKEGEDKNLCASLLNPYTDLLWKSSWTSMVHVTMFWKVYTTHLASPRHHTGC